MFDLKGRVALVTGARRGMGKSHSIFLAMQGAKVVVTDIDLKECEEVVKEIEGKGGQAVAFKMDVSNKAEVDSVFDNAVKKYGKVDILVNNAGIFDPKPFLQMTEEDFQKTIDINLKGEFLCAQRAAKEMMKNKWGRIINIASIASGGVGVGYPGGAHYTASKGGIIGMTETLAQELGPLGINVNVIAPGAIDTPMISASSLPEQAMNALLQRLPIKRIGKSEDVSAVVVLLSSEEASYITGATFYVDGGWLAV